MKRIFILSLTLMFAMSAFPQKNEDPKQKLNELSITFSNLDRFGLAYKTGRDQSLWRFHTLMASKVNQESSPNENHTSEKQNSFQYMLRIGRAHISEINNEVDFRFGADLFYGYSEQTNLYDPINDNQREYWQKNKTNTFGMNLVFGFNYSLNEHILIGAEILPHISYDKGILKHYTDGQVYDKQKTDITAFSYGMSNNSAEISLTYRF